MPKSVGEERVGLHGRSRTCAHRVRSTSPEVPRAMEMLVAQCGLEPQSSAYEAPAFTHVLQRLN